MWRASKKEGEAYHSRRELMVSCDKVYRKFLEWPEYQALKAELLAEGSTFKDPGRTTFLSTRCGCLGGSMRELNKCRHKVVEGGGTTVSTSLAFGCKRMEY